MSTDEANREGLVSLPVTAVLDMRSAICRAVGLTEERTRCLPLREGERTHFRYAQTSRQGVLALMKQRERARFPCSMGYPGGL